jgi:hypothetical protein
MGMAAAAVLVSFIAFQLAASAQETSRPPELKVLDRWAGEWDVEITVKPNRNLPQGGKSTYLSVGKWVLNDRIMRVEAQGQGQSGDRKFKDGFSWNVTHDTNLKAYASVTLWSNVATDGSASWGISPALTGTWDEKEQTLAMRQEDTNSGIITISVTQWIDPDNHKFAMSTTDGQGRVLMEMSGSAKRRK